MEEIKEINEDIIRLKEAMNMIRERENSIKEQNEALEDETRIVKAQREEQKIAKAEEDLKEFKDLTIEIILRMANKVKEIRKTAQMQYIKDSVNAVRAVQERKNLQNKRIKLLNKKNAELNNDKLTETERARKEKFIEAISIKIENEQKEIDGLPNVKKVEENWKKTSDDLNNAEETLNKYRLILLGIRVQTQNEYEQDEPAPGEPTPSRPVQGEPTPSEPIQGEQEQGEPTPDEPVQDEQAQDEPTPSEPVQDEQAQDEPIEQPELVDKDIIKATEEARRKYIDLIRRAQIGNNRNKQYEKDINLAESRGDHTLAKKIDEERKKFLESYPKEPEIKRAEENLRRNEIKSAIICGAYDEGVKDCIRRNLEETALSMLKKEERDKLENILKEGYIGGVHINMQGITSVLVGGPKYMNYKKFWYHHPKRGKFEQEKRKILERYGIKMKRREIRKLDLRVLDAFECVVIPGDDYPDYPSEEEITAFKEYVTAYHKSLTDNPDSPRIAIEYVGEGKDIDRKSFNASKRYMRQAQKFGGTIQEGWDVRTPWQKFIDFLKKPKMIEEGDGKEESEQQGEQTDEKTPQGGQAAKDFRDRNHDEKAAATVGETAQQNAQKAQEAQDRTEGNAEQEK